MHNTVFLPSVFTLGLIIAASCASKKQNSNPREESSLQEGSSLTPPVSEFPQVKRDRGSHRGDSKLRIGDEVDALQDEIDSGVWDPKNPVHPEIPDWHDLLGDDIQELDFDPVDFAEWVKDQEHPLTQEDCDLSHSLLIDGHCHKRSPENLKKLCLQNGMQWSQGQCLAKKDAGDCHKEGNVLVPHLNGDICIAIDAHREACEKKGNRWVKVRQDDGTFKFECKSTDEIEWYACEKILHGFYDSTNRDCLLEDRKKAFLDCVFRSGFMWDRQKGCVGRK